VRVTFVPREQPLVPAAAVAVGAAARRLGRRLLEEDSRLAELRGLGSGDLLLVIGDADSLPWSDGIAYLGRDSEAPRLLLPTALRPDVPLDLFERALFRRSESASPERQSPAAGGVLAVLASPRRLVQVGLARRIERPLLEQWLSRCT
jgi:hypothetical protein